MPKSEADHSPLQLVPKREKQLKVRIDDDLYKAATEKAGSYGLGAVVRAFLRAFARGELELPQEDLARELTSAPRLRTQQRQRKG